MKKGTGVLSLFAILLLCLPTISYGQLITIKIEAIVNGVTDDDNLLGSNISVGDTITGTYTYDTSTLDANPTIDEYSTYQYNDSPCGIELKIGNFVFKSNPSNVNFLMVIENNFLELDRYTIHSYNNSFIINGETIVQESYKSKIAWFLEDSTCSALLDTELPSSAPILSNWDYNSLIIDANGHALTITAQVISAVLIPEPMSILLFGFGLLALRKQK